MSLVPPGSATASVFVSRLFESSAVVSFYMNAETSNLQTISIKFPMMFTLFCSVKF